MKTRVTVLTAAVLCCILFVLDVFIYFTLHARLMNIEETALLSKAQSISQSYANIISSGRAVLPKPDANLNGRWTNFAWMHAYRQYGQQIVLMNTEGHVVAASDRRTVDQLLADFSALHHPERQTVRQLPDSALFVSMPVLNQTNQNIGYVLLLSDISEVTEYMENLLVLLVGGSVGAVLLAALGGYIVSAVAVRPISEMIRKVQKIQLGRLNERVAEPLRRDEVAHLASTFNQMLTRMERSFEQQSRFVTDASHEILTPLTTIQGYANLLARWGKDNPDVLDKGIRVIQKESSRLQELAENLLTLAALESSAKERDRRTDVTATIDEVIESVSVFPSHVTITRDITGTPVVGMAPSHLRQILTNLVENAVKYQNGPGEIRVAARQMKNKVELVVEDQGRGIPEEDIPHIFERFYRVDKSRGRREGGLGLGLSIVKELVETYGGQIAVTSQLGVGTTFTVILPAGVGDLLNE